MTKNAYILVCLVTSCLAVIASGGMVQAEDEDMSSSLYLVFDPETGEFIEVSDPDRTLQNDDDKDPAFASLGHRKPSHGASLSLLASLAVAAGLLAIILVPGLVSKSRSVTNSVPQRED